MHARVVLGVGKGVLFREVSSVQECPHRWVPLPKHNSSDAAVISSQISAELQSVEEVPQELLVSPSPRRPVCATHARYTECCHNTLLTHFSLPIPLSATQTFSTSCGQFPVRKNHQKNFFFSVSLKWQVHFQFLLSRNSAHQSSNHAPQDEDSAPISTATTLQTLNSSSVDAMTWDLPITVLPTVSLHSDERTTAHTVTI